MNWKRLFARASVLALLTAQAASAQDNSLNRVDLERLQLNPGGEDSQVVGTGRTPGLSALRVGALMHYQSQPLRLMYGGGEQAQKAGALVSSRLGVNFFGAYAPLERLELNFQLPVVLSQRGDDLSAQGIAAPRGSGIGTPRVGAEYQLVRTEVGGLGVNASAGVQLALPFGTPEAWAGDEKRSLGVLPRAAASVDFGPVTAGMEVGATFRSAQSMYDQELGSQLDVGAVLVTDAALLRGPRLELALVSGVPLASGDKSVGVSTELLGGVRIPVASSGLEFTALGGPGFGSAAGTPVYRATVGLAYALPERARPVDPCSTANHNPAQCPTLDADRDAIANAQDVCPLVAEDKDGVQDADGCVDPDDDADGILDTADACREVPGVAAYNGCPVPDTDKDGVYDSQDRCPSEAGLADRGGCPLKDRDGDTVADEVDNCPDEAGVPANQGCKVRQLVTITREKLVISEKVFFARNESRVLEKSFELLTQVANVLKNQPSIKKVQVEGHTDTRGLDSYNKRLSEERAKAVRDFLVTQGVEPERLEARGFGSAQPADTNDTAAGRENNRRVEFTILAQEMVSETREVPEAPKAPEATEAPKAPEAPVKQ